MLKCQVIPLAPQRSAYPEPGVGAGTDTGAGVGAGAGASGPRSDSDTEEEGEEAVLVRRATHAPPPPACTHFVGMIPGGLDTMKLMEARVHAALPPPLTFDREVVQVHPPVTAEGPATINGHEVVMPALVPLVVSQSEGDTALLACSKHQAAALFAKPSQLEGMVEAWPGHWLVAGARTLSLRPCRVLSLTVKRTKRMSHEKELGRGARKKRDEGRGFLIGIRHTGLSMTAGQSVMLVPPPLPTVEHLATVLRRALHGDVNLAADATGTRLVIQAPSAVSKATIAGAWVHDASSPTKGVPLTTKPLVAKPRDRYLHTAGKTGRSAQGVVNALAAFLTCEQGSLEVTGAEADLPAPWAMEDAGHAAVVHNRLAEDAPLTMDCGATAADVGLPLRPASATLTLGEVLGAFKARVHFNAGITAIFTGTLDDWGRAILNPRGVPLDLGDTFAEALLLKPRHMVVDEAGFSAVVTDDAGTMFPPSDHGDTVTVTEVGLRLVTFSQRDTGAVCGVPTASLMVDCTGPTVSPEAVNPLQPSIVPVVLTVGAHRTEALVRPSFHTAGTMPREAGFEVRGINAAPGEPVTLTSPYFPCGALLGRAPTLTLTYKARL